LLKKSPDSESFEPSKEIKREEKASHNYALWGGVAFAVVLIALLAWSWIAGENPATSHENKITGQASAANNSQVEKPKTICEFCLETNDTVYKNSGACKPCF
jgi:hypothetical protein